MATVTKPIALDESLNTTEQSSRNIADVLAQEIGNLVTVVSRIAPSTTVSWNQIQQSGTKIAQITINGTSTDVYAPTGGGGFSALIIITADAGQTVTATKGGDTYTATEVTSGTYEVTVDSAGTWTISDGTISDTIAIPSSGTYYVTLSSVPDGKTVTPTDDVQILLACAGITDKSYTTLTELFADTTTLASVIADNNAIDYLKRSTTFAKSEALVPAMTSDNTPSGECFSDTPLSGYPAFQAFDGDGSTQWCASSSTSSGGSYIGYDFVNPTKCFNVDVLCASLGNSVRVEASDDKSVWTTVSQTVAIPYNEVYSIPLTPTKAYRYYRVYKTSSSQQNKLAFYTVQFYSEDGFTDNATAMSYIGLNNYASNTLLGDATWCSAICNSTYFESVLNVKVPVMTSNTTPSGVVSASGEIQPAYYAFDGNDNTYWYGSTSTSMAGQYIQYEFASPCKVCMVYMTHTNAKGVWKLFGEDNGSWEEIGTATFTSIAVIYPYPTKTYKNYRWICTSSDTSYILTISELQFYGRADV